MTQQIINVGAAPNDGQGDPIRTAFTKCNNNFDELYARSQISPPPTLVGSVGDVEGMTAYDENFYYYCFQDFDGSSQIWNKVPNTGNAQVTLLTATGDVTANAFIGDGSQLTNVVAGSPTSIVNGNSNVIVNSNGNVTISATGRANILTITNLVVGSTPGYGLFVDGQLATFGNLISFGNVSANNYVHATQTITGGNLVSNAGISGATLSLSGNVTSNLNLSSHLTVSSSANVIGNIRTSGYFIGDGGFLSNVTAVSNVAVTQIANGTSSVAVTGSGGDITIEVGGVSNVAVFKTTGVNLANTTVGNIFTDGYYYANGSPFAGGGSGNYGNSNVAAYLPTYTGNLSPGNLDVQTAFYIGGTAFTRTLTVGTRSSPVTVPLATNNSFNVLARTGNVSIYTT